MPAHEEQSSRRDRKRKDRIAPTTPADDVSLPTHVSDESPEVEKQRRISREGVRSGKGEENHREPNAVEHTSLAAAGAEGEGGAGADRQTHADDRIESAVSLQDEQRPAANAHTTRRRGGRSHHNRPAPVQDDATDIIFRIMHATPRTDELEVVRCRFGPAECERAAKYFDDTYMTNPLRRLRFQIGCSAASGLNTFFPKIGFHWQSLRLLDLSRNDISADELAVLCSALHLHEESSALEVLDLSYNRRVGNSGAVHVLDMTKHNRTLRALILKSVSIDESGARSIWEYLKRREQPDESERHVWGSLSLSVPKRAFFINLNENLIGAYGTSMLGKHLPDYVSITIVKQRVKRQ